jgi:hypothetical protein
MDRRGLLRGLLAIARQTRELSNFSGLITNNTHTGEGGGIGKTEHSTVQSRLRVRAR